MKKFYYLFAAAVSVALASCTNEVLVEQGPGTEEEINTAINFGFDFQKYTRGEIGGKAASDLLGGHFYVTGTKGTEESTYPTPTLVFDNYLVHFGINTAGTTESNTANWEYVGVTPGAAPDVDYVKLGSYSKQTIKYWDNSVNQYDFLAFSTGTFKAVAGTSGADNEIGVTAMQYGAGLDVSSSVPTAYTFDLPSEDALKNTYITDITEVKKADFRKEVTLTFKNLGSKVRVAFYETIPGYSVKNVRFYATDEANATPADLGTGTSETATLISNTGIPSKGSIAVLFPHVGTNNDTKTDYNKAMASVTPGVGAELTSKTLVSLQINSLEKKIAKRKVMEPTKMAMSSWAEHSPMQHLQVLKL